MNDNKLKSIIKEAFVTQFNLFDEPTVTKVRKPRKKMSEREKEERREARKLQKKIEADKEFDRLWREKRGLVQGKLFSDEELDECTKRTIENVVKEEIEKVIMEKEGIDINPENKGKFTQTKERTGKTTSELLQSKNKTTKARANFARMAKRGWKPLKK